MSLFESTSHKRYAVEFNAGKCIVEGNMVRPDLRKGTVYMDQCEDQLLHFCWKERDSEQAEDDIIIFTGGAIFTRIDECTTGRVYMLQLSHSKEKHLYWMQSKSDEKDLDHYIAVNELIGDSDQDINMSTELNENASHDEIMRLLNGVENQDPNITEENVLEFLQSMSRNRERKPQAEESKKVPAKPSETQPNSETQPDYGRLAQMLTQPTAQQTSSSRRPIVLTDILNTSSILPLLNDPTVCASLFPHLPDSVEASPEQLRQVVSSPQFSQALQSLTVALETGQLGPLLSQFGLDANAFGVEAFLNSIQKQADNKKQDKMEE